MKKHPRMSEHVEGLQPSRTVELTCAQCAWSAWFDPLAPEVMAAVEGVVHICTTCRGRALPTEKASCP